MAGQSEFSRVPGAGCPDGKLRCGAGNRTCWDTFEALYG